MCFSGSWSASRSLGKRLLITATPLLVCALAFFSTNALACGGFFCSTGPVDQQGEHILFEVHDGGDISAVVQVSYNGDPSAFSWVIPVPEAPQVDVVPALTLDILDVLTKPTVVPAPLDYTSCEDGQYPLSRAVGCSDQALMSAPGSAQDLAREEAVPGDVVSVVEIPRVGPYDDIVFVSSDDPNALVAWLNDNGYIITPPMEPLVAQYVAEGQGFLALKLAPDAGVEDIAPVKFTCPGTNPIIPLRLTAVSAQPDMRVLVHVIGSTRYQPTNYRDVVLDPAFIRTDLYGFRTNYDAVMSHEVDVAGGRAFRTERAGPTDEIRTQLLQTNTANDDEAEAVAYLDQLLSGSPYLTRLYTRMSAADMSDDPVFAASDGAPVDGTIDLSDRPAVDACATTLEEAEPLCGFSYCGLGAQCAVTGDGTEGCLCPQGQVARQVRTPTAFYDVPTVVCQDLADDLLSNVLGIIGDPCDGFNCGEGGICVAVNGFPSCACGENAAIVDANVPGGIKCAPASELYGPDRLAPSLSVDAAGNAIGGIAPLNVGCASMWAGHKTPSLLELSGMLFLFWTLRRRRRLER